MADNNTTNIPEERQITFEATGDRIWDLDQLPLTRVHSGDMDNGMFISFLETNPKEKRRLLTQYCRPRFEQVLETKIFRQDINDDSFRKICFMLTLYDAIMTVLKGAGVLCSVDEMYFATMVNYNCSRGISRNRIRSYSALMEIKQSEMNSGDGSLNYSEYLITGSNGEFDNEYVSIKINSKDYSCDFLLHLPIIQCRLGRFRFATERIPAMMSWIGDIDNVALTVPPHIWLEMIKEGMGRRLTAKFFKGEAKNLSKLIDADSRFIDEVCDMNDFKVVLSFINAYQLEVNDNNEIEIYNTKEKPKIEGTRAIKWEEIRQGSGNWALASDFFYVAKLSSSTVQIRMLR